MRKLAVRLAAAGLALTPLILSAPSASAEPPPPVIPGGTFMIKSVYHNECGQRQPWKEGNDHIGGVRCNSADPAQHWTFDPKTLHIVSQDPAAVDQCIGVYINSLRALPCDHNTVLFPDQSQKWEFTEEEGPTKYTAFTVLINQDGNLIHPGGYQGWTAFNPNHGTPEATHYAEDTQDLRLIPVTP